MPVVPEVSSVTYIGYHNNSHSMFPLCFKSLRNGHFRESCTGVRYSRDAWLADFIFSWNVNLGNHCSSSVTWRFCVTREQLELLTNIRDFTTLFYVILRRKSFEWLESSIRYRNCKVVPWVSLSWFCFLLALFLESEQVIKKSTLLAYFRDSGKRNFYIRDPWSSIFAVREPC